MADEDLQFLDQDLLQLYAGCFNTSGSDNQSESSSSCNFSDLPNQTVLPYDVLLHETVWRVFVIAVYCIVIVLGALLNILVVATVVKTKQMWNATNIFIANLAIADIFVCVFDLPLSLYQALTGSWIFGRALCHVIPMTFGVVVYTSTLTLTMIAIDRFILIVFPLKRRMTVTMAMMFVVVIALIAIAVASPIAIFAQLEEYYVPEVDYKTSICLERWPTTRHRQVYTIATLVAQYFLPLVIILCLYALIFKHLRNRLQKRSSRKTKTTKMLVAVVLVFALTWTPFHLLAIIIDFKPQLVPGSYIRLIDVLLKIFALSSSCINPFLYGWLNDNYRTAFLSIIKRPTASISGIQREDSDEMSRTRPATNLTVTPLKQLYHKINSTGKARTPRTSPSPTHKGELMPLQEHKVGNGCDKPANGEKQVLVTVENGHCTASVQTPLLT